MTPWVEGMDLENVSISEADIQNGSPKQGDMIAVSKSDPNDKWLVAKDFFEKEL